MRPLFEAWATYRGPDPDGLRFVTLAEPLQDVGLPLAPVDGRQTPLQLFKDCMVRIYATGLKPASVTDRAIGRPWEPTQAYEAAGHFEQALVEIGASFVAGAEPLELVQPGEGALDDPADLAQSGAVGDASSGDQGFDAAFPQQAAVLVEVVAPVGVQAPGLAAWTSPPARERRRAEAGAG